MSKAPRHQGPKLRLCCGLLSSCPTQKGSVRSLRKTLVGCSPRCRCPHICVGGRTNRPCEPPNGYKRSTSKTSRVASSRPGSGSGCRCPMGSRPRSAALYGLEAPHEEGSDRGRIYRNEGAVPGRVRPSLIYYIACRPISCRGYWLALSEPLFLVDKVE